MKTPKQKLIDLLICHGWDIEELDDDNLEWWADEMWLLKSHWRPQNKIAYITALVDPQHDGIRRKGESVWAYGLSEDIPTTSNEAQMLATACFGKAFKNDMESLVDAILELRDKSSK